VAVECRVVPVDSLGVSRVPAEQEELRPAAERRDQPLKKSTKHSVLCTKVLTLYTDASSCLRKDQFYVLAVA